MPLLIALSNIGTLGFIGYSVYDVIKGLMQKDNGETKYTQTAKAVEAETEIPADDVKKLAAMTMYSKIEEDNKSPDDFWNSLSEEARAELKWSPEQLRRIEGLANFSAIATGFAWMTATLAGATTAVGALVISGKTLQQIGAAKIAGTLTKELPVIMATAKFKGIRTLVVPSVVAAVSGMAAWLIPQINNQLQDPGQWGRIMLEQLEQKRTQLAGGASGTGYAQTPKTRITESKTAKPKLFTGIIFNGQVGPYEQFVRAVDDKITSDADLKADVEINLAKYFETIDNNLSYSIQIKNSPNDELGIPRSGTWCTLSIYLTNQFHKRVFIDEILLGPVDPFVYYPESQKVEQLQYEIPKLVKFDTLHPMDTYRGQERIVSTTGDVITDVLKDGTKVVAGVSVTAPMAQTVAVAGAPTTPREKMSRYGITLYKGENGIIYHERGTEALVAGMGEITDSANIQSALGINLSEIPNLPGRTQDELLKAGLNGAQRAKRNYTATQFAEYLNQYVVNEFGTGAGQATAQSFPKQVTVKVDKLNVRSQPTSQSATAGSQQLYKGDVFTAVALVEGETVSGNNKWWKSSKGNFVWSGGTD